MELEDIQLLYRFAVAVVLGFFIGLQREYAYRRDAGRAEGELLAGARTFPIIALLGAAAALGSTELGSGWPLAAAILSVAVLLAVGHFHQARERDMGLTTEMA